MAKKSKRTKKLQFDIKTRERIIERDGGCIFCAMGYPTKDATWLDLTIKDIMHFIPKSQGGLGIEQNGALGCRYHHSKLDNGNDGAREIMLAEFESYLQNIYPDWNKENLVYKKYDLTYQSCISREDSIFIDGQECVKTDEWKSGDDVYVLGNSVEDSDFFYAEVNGNTHFQYDYKPGRVEIEDDFINLEAVKDIDRHEAEVFSRFEGSDF